MCFSYYVIIICYYCIFELDIIRFYEWFISIGIIKLVKKNKLKENFMVILCYLLGIVLGYCNFRVYSYMYIISKKFKFCFCSL